MTPKRTTLDTDTRGVSEVLGAILIFALVLVVIALIQVWAVPAANQQIEFEHNQRAVGDFQDFSSSIGRAAIDDAPGSTPVEIGVRYPPRLFLLNPPAPAGIIDTRNGTVVLQNANATDTETRDYLEGDPHTFATRSMSYRPNYNEYGSAPTTRLEGWTLYNDFETNNIVLDQEGLLSGRTVRLTTLDGEFSRSSQGTVTLPVTPISAPSQAVSVRGQNASNPVTLRLTSGLSAAEWTRVLSDEPHFDEAIQIDSETVEIRLEYADANGPITYTLRMSKVGIGSNLEDVSPHYMTDIGDPQLDGSGGSVTVQVRDKYNNPVPGAAVQFESDDASIPTPTVTTDENGEATVRFNNPATDRVTITATTTVASGPRQTDRGSVVFEDIAVLSESIQASEINRNDASSLTLESALAQKIGSGSTQRWVVDVRFRNRGDDKVISATRINAYISSTISQGKLLVPARADVEGTDHEIKGEYVSQPAASSFETKIAGGTTETYRFEFRLADGSNHQPDGGDFYIFSVRFKDGGTSRYFIQPRS